VSRDRTRDNSTAEAQNAHTNAGGKSVRTAAFRCGSTGGANADSDRARHATAWRQAPAGRTRARCKSGAAVVSDRANQASYGSRVTAARCNPSNTTTPACCKSGDAARERKAGDTGRGRCEPTASSSAKSCSAPAKGMPARKEHVGRERPARLQIDRQARRRLASALHSPLTTPARNARVKARALTRSRHALFLRGKERVQKHEVVH